MWSVVMLSPSFMSASPESVPGGAEAPGEGLYVRPAHDLDAAPVGGGRYEHPVVYGEALGHVAGRLAP